MFRVRINGGEVTDPRLKALIGGFAVLIVFIVLLLLGTALVAAAAVAAGAALALAGARALGLVGRRPTSLPTGGRPDRPSLPSNDPSDRS